MSKMKLYSKFVFKKNNGEYTCIELHRKRYLLPCRYGFDYDYEIRVDGMCNDYGFGNSMKLIMIHVYSVIRVVKSGEYPNCEMDIKNILDDIKRNEHQKQYIESIIGILINSAPDDDTKKKYKENWENIKSQIIEDEANHSLYLSKIFNEFSNKI